MAQKPLSSLPLPAVTVRTLLVEASSRKLHRMARCRTQHLLIVLIIPAELGRRQSASIRSCLGTISIRELCDLLYIIVYCIVGATISLKCYTG